MPLEEIAENPWNPNEMTPAELSLLADNMRKVGYVDPILVAPIDPAKNGGAKYRIVDGEHRFKVLLQLGVQKVPVVIADFDETTQKVQTVRMNKIKGVLNYEKFNRLVDSLVDSGEVGLDEAAFELGFADEDEFELIRASMRESLPDKKTKKEFDAKAKDAKSVDDLYDIVMKIMQKYSDTLPANFMVVTVGRGRNLWVRLEGTLVRRFESLGNLCIENGVTFDSFIVAGLLSLDPQKFIEENRSKLAAVGSNVEDIDDVLETDEEAEY